MSGCRDCANRYNVFGECHCELKPHNYVTNEQKAIVAWLSQPNVNAFVDGGCPSYIDWKICGTCRGKSQFPGVLECPACNGFGKKCED
jgi:hypothetical protein